MEPSKMDSLIWKTEPSSFPASVSPPWKMASCSLKSARDLCWCLVGGHGAGVINDRADFLPVPCPWLFCNPWAVPWFLLPWVRSSMVLRISCLRPNPFCNYGVRTIKKWYKYSVKATFAAVTGSWGQFMLLKGNSVQYRIRSCLLFCL